MYHPHITLFALKRAEVVELVDTLGSGSSGSNPVEVRVFSSAPPDNTGCDSDVATLCFFEPTPLSVDFEHHRHIPHDKVPL